EDTKLWRALGRNVVPVGSTKGGLPTVMASSNTLPGPAATQKPSGLPNVWRTNTVKSGSAISLGVPLYGDNFLTRKVSIWSGGPHKADEADALGAATMPGSGANG